MNPLEELSGSKRGRVKMFNEVNRLGNGIENEGGDASKREIQKPFFTGGHPHEK